MNKKLQDLVWSILPKEFKEEVKELYNSSIKMMDIRPSESHVYANKLTTLEHLFGHHNLTSDAEGEEMLTVPRSKVQKLYNKFNRSFDNVVSDYLRGHYKAKMGLLKELFGPKCLPDEEPKPAEPKFKRCEKVITPSGEVRIIEDTHCENGDWLYLVGDPAQWIPESDLEPYTEPQEESRNYSQNIVNYDKEFNKILKDSSL